MREVALTYRRETRAAQAEGAKPPEQHHRVYEAAHAKYVELDRPSGQKLMLGARQLRPDSRHAVFLVKRAGH
jgi:hypothetical protein